MEKPKLASPKRVPRRNRKSVKKTEPTVPKMTLRSMLIAEWEKRPLLTKLEPSAAEIEKFKEDYKVWQMQMDLMLRR